MITKQRMNEFLKTGQPDYFIWLRENYPAEAARKDGCCSKPERQTQETVERENDEPPDATFGTMFTDLARSFHSIIKSGSKVVDNAEHQRRYEICLGCEHLTEHGRCKKCGCFMKFKSKFASMRCKVGKW